jgi:Leucine-rich repeat (LRR) protein
VFKGETALGALTALTELSLTASVGVWADFSPAGYSAAALAAASGQPPPRPGLRAVLPSVMLLPAMPHEQQLQVLPQLASLSNLRRLSLANNRYMRTLPACLSALTQLEVLDARACSIAFLNEELWQCTGLRELLLSDNVVQMLPDNIGQLKQLKVGFRSVMGWPDTRCAFGDNPRPCSRPLPRLSATQVLDVGSCPTLWQLPTTLLSLSQLTRLVVVSKRIGQYVIEQLEMRPTPVEVEFEGDSDFTDDDDEEGLDPDDPAIYEEHWTDDDYGDEADDPEMWYHAV